MMKIIGYDIETVPQGNLSIAQEEWIEGKMERGMANKSSSETIDQLRSKIMATSPYLGEIICISIGELIGTTIKTKSFIGEEIDILSDFWQDMIKADNALFVSFNGLGFDANFIAMRSLHHKVKPTNKSFLNTRKYYKFPHFDVMKWMSDWAYPVPNLDVACDLAGVTSSKEGEIKAKDVAKAFTNGRIDEIAEYCENDVRATLEVYFKLKPYIRD